MTTRYERALLRAATRAFLAMASTWRIVIRMPDNSITSPEVFSFERELYAIRERDLLALVPIARLTNALTLIAEGKDGDRATVVAETLGASAVRGSSLHDPEAAALRFCRGLKNWEGPGLIVVDGPVGPIGVAKPGVAALACHSGRPVRCVAVDARPKLSLFYLWSKMIIPLPFSRVVFSLSPELHVASSERAQVERAAEDVTKSIDRCASRAAELLMSGADLPGGERQVAR